MAAKPIVILAFAAQSPQAEEIQKEKAKLTPIWQLQKTAEVIILEQADAQQLSEAIELHKDRLLLLHLAGTVDRFSVGKNADWMLPLAAAPKLEFVFLSGCGTFERLGELLEKGIKCVVASQYGKDQKAVFRFAEMFYAQLIGRSSLLNAFEKSAGTLAEKYQWDDVPSAVFYEKEKQNPGSLGWGIYLYPLHQSVLSWKFPLPLQIREPSISRLEEQKIVVEVEKQSKRGLGFPSFQKFFKNLFKSVVPQPSRSEVPTMPSMPSPGAPSPPSTSEKKDSGLEVHIKKEEESGLPGKIESARQGLTPEFLPELLALEAEWKALTASFEDKTLVKKAVEGKLPFLELSPGRIEAIIEQALAEELYELHAQLIENKVDALLQPQMRGLVLRKPISKSEVGKYHALIIGINQYDDSDIRSLTGALQDARALHKLLSEKYFFDHIQLLENPDRDAIIDAFDELDFQAAEGDNVLIFYAGHGKWDQDSGIGYWLPRNAHDDRSRNWIENSTIHNAIKRLKACQHVLLISDSCFSGALLDTREVMAPAIRQEDKEIRILYDAKSRQILTSGAKEPVPDDSSFFKYLIESLEKLPEKTLATHSLFHHVRSKVLNSPQQGQNPQVGKILHAGDDGGDFVFFRR